MLKKIVFTIVFFIIASTSANAEMPLIKQEYKANPVNINLNAAANFIEPYFEITNLPDKYNIKSAFLELKINSSSQNGILKLLNPTDNRIIQAISLSSVGTKFYYGLENEFSKLIGENYLKIKLIADGLSSDENINIEQIILKIEYESLDTEQPKILNVEVKETTKDSAIVKWSVNEPSNSYFEYGKTSNYDKSGEVTCEDKEATVDCTVLLINLNTGTTYHFQIRTEDLAGNAFITGDFTLVTKPDLNTGVLGESNLALSKITGLNFKQEGMDVHVNWTAAKEPNIDGYYVFRQKGNYEYERVAILDKLATKYIDTDIFPDTEYKYRVRSYHGADLSSDSDTLIVKISEGGSILGVSTVNLDRVLIVVFLLSFGVITASYLFGKRIVTNLSNAMSPKKTKVNLFRDPVFYMKEMDNSSRE